jgi:type VI protein secretion system component VasF
MVRRIRVLFTVIAAAALTAAPAIASQSQPAQDGFVPVTGVPASEQIPAGPLVVAAYAFFLLLMVFYLWTIWRRIGKVEADMRALERRQGAGGHAK